MTTTPPPRRRRGRRRDAALLLAAAVAVVVAVAVAGRAALRPQQRQRGGGLPAPSSSSTAMPPDPDRRPPFPGRSGSPGAVADAFAVDDALSAWEAAFFDGGGEDEDAEDEDGGEEEVVAAVAAAAHRRLMPTKRYSLGEYVTENDYSAETASAFVRSAADGGNDHVDNFPLIHSYTYRDVLDEADVFEYTFGAVVYSPKDNEFVVLYHRDHQWKNANRKLFKAIEDMVYMLRHTFPWRFTPTSPEMVLAIGGGDYPHVRRSKVPHDGTAPVLMFGSSFRDPDVYSNMVAMPLPHNRHMKCFVEYMQYKRVCAEMTAIDPNANAEGGTTTGGWLVFGEEFGLGWDDLIPQLVWRGTDFRYLPSIEPLPHLVHPSSSEFVRTPKRGGVDARVAATQSLLANYDALLPRWKGVALAAEAALDVEGTDELPWADIKFSSYNDKTGKQAAEGTKTVNGKHATVGSSKYALWESVDIGIDEGKPRREMAKYKYHIDLGGGSGTSWTGTIEKLAMPGLLFHHMTHTKDYVHDRMRAWKHYVPVATDLKDLRSKFDWAESHPAEARRIADAGTAFVRELGTVEGYGRMFEDDFVTPMRRVIDAYKPVPRGRDDTTLWEDLLQSVEDCRVLPVMKCSGMELENSCRIVDREDILEWQNVCGEYKGPTY